MKRIPKFKVGDELVVVSSPFEVTSYLIGFEFTVIKVAERDDEIAYIYEEDDGNEAMWTEEYLELSEIAKSPLGQALR